MKSEFTYRKEKRGPLEVVEGKNTRIPMYDAGDGKVLLAYYVEGRRKLAKCQSLEAGRKRARQIIEDLTSGIAHVGNFTTRQTAAINDAVEILRPTGVSLSEAARQFAEAHRLLEGSGSLSDAVKCFLEERKKAQLSPIRVPDLVEKFMQHLRGQKKSRRYTLDMQARLHKAAETFTGFVGDIHATGINRWLLGMRHVGGRTKNNYRAALATLLSFARQEGHLARGIPTEAEFSSRFDGRSGEIGIYAAEKLRILLFRLEPRLMPFVAIGAFAGLRSAEIVRLEWQEIRFAQNVIEIKASKAKTASRRLAPILPVLAEWLSPVRRESGQVLVGVKDEFALATQFKKAVDAIKDEDGKPLVKIIHNGLRHSFITYRMAVLKNAAQVALEAGNSPRMIFEHYRELVTEAEANAWFAVRPDEAKVEFLKAA
ncbi:MAG: site-specific integrase [Terrimicrobiaceae bacterium]